MAKSYCNKDWDHQPNEKCPECGLETNGYGNTEQDFTFCQFPHCGCDGSQSCMASEGPTGRADTYNIQGMWIENSLEGRGGIADAMTGEK